MPPRWTTKPTRSRRTAPGPGSRRRSPSARRSTGGRPGSSSARALEVARAVRVRRGQADELLLAGGLGRGSSNATQRFTSSGLRSGATRSPSSSRPRKNGQTAGSDGAWHCPRSAASHAPPCGDPSFFFFFFSGRCRPRGDRRRAGHPRAALETRSDPALPVSLKQRTPSTNETQVPPAHCRGGIPGDTLRVPFRANINETANVIVAPAHRRWRLRDAPRAVTVPLPAPATSQSPEAWSVAPRAAPDQALHLPPADLDRSRPRAPLRGRVPFPGPRGADPPGRPRRSCRSATRAPRRTSPARTRTDRGGARTGLWPPVAEFLVLAWCVGHLVEVGAVRPHDVDVLSGRVRRRCPRARFIPPSGDHAPRLAAPSAPSPT